MVEELQRSSALYRPSRFWEGLARENEQMLSRHGLANLKRTVGQNYFNWLVVHPENAQLRNALRYWRSHPTLRPLLNRMERMGFIHSAVGLEKNMTRLGWKEHLLYKTFVGVLWEVARHSDRTGLAEVLQEPEVGNPIRIRRKGRLISQDLANSIREYSTILEAQPDIGSSPGSIAELGAGYGRLAYVMLQHPGPRYFIFDIPPALAVAQWYLTELFGHLPIFRFRRIASFASVADELQSSRIAFFTPNQLELFPDGYFRAFVSISTLPEMNAQQVNNYLRLIAEKTSRLVYFKQWKRWANPDDDYTLSQADMTLGGGFRKAIERDDVIQDAFFESVWIR